MYVSGSDSRVEKKGVDRMYDVIVVSPTKEKENVQLECIWKNPGETTQKIDIKGAILLELRVFNEHKEIEIWLPCGRTQVIHTKKMILKAYTTIQESKILSLYEVLWAAKVELDPETLQPIRHQ